MSNTFTNKTKTAIDNHSKKLGNDIDYQLFQARQKALSHVKNRKSSSFMTWLVPMAVAATLAIYIVLPKIQHKTISPTSEPEVYVDVNDIELIEQLELVENLEFYEWLSQEDDLSSI